MTSKALEIEALVMSARATKKVVVVFMVLIKLFTIQTNITGAGKVNLMCLINALFFGDLNTNRVDVTSNRRTPPREWRF